MAGLVGEYEVTLDAKGRFLFPSGLRKQLAPAAQETFIKKSKPDVSGFNSKP